MWKLKRERFERERERKKKLGNRDTYFPPQLLHSNGPKVYISQTHTHTLNCSIDQKYTQSILRNETSFLGNATTHSTDLLPLSLSLSFFTLFPYLKDA